MIELECLVIQISECAGGDAEAARGGAVRLHRGEVRERRAATLQRPDLLLLLPARAPRGEDAGGAGQGWHHEQGHELRCQPHL